ncbi:MAG TPA: HAD-IA family hydrolase [Chthoniobacter sp.]|jgi:putative hydrolase of the HAD superfamily
MIKTIFFDAAGTLFHLPRGVGWHYRDVASRFGCSLDEDTLSHAFRTAWKQMPDCSTTRQPRPDDDKGWWFTLVGQVLDDCQVPPQQLDREAYFETLYHEFTRPQVWELFPEVHDTLSALSPRFRLGLISNFDGRLRPILTDLGILPYFDPLIISSEVGADKPDPWIFQQALSRAGANPAEALHVGDEPRGDWQGAAQAGLKVFQLDRPKNSLRDLLTDLA